MDARKKQKLEFHSRPFEKLKQRIRHHEADQPLPVRDSLPGPQSPSDEEVFAHAMTDVQEIPAFRVLPCSNTPRLRDLPHRETDPDADALHILDQIAQGETPINLSVTQEFVEWTNPEVHIEITEKLHIGHFAVQGMLDLHGYTVSDVNSEVDAFLDDSRKRGLRCVKIIHGRGLRSVKGPVVKDAVIKRLAGKQSKKVIAFVSARQCDGGLGALYVVLRNA